MTHRVLPKLGEVLPVDKFHVSELNVRAGRPFGESEEDRASIDHTPKSAREGLRKTRGRSNFPR